MRIRVKNTPQAVGILICVIIAVTVFGLPGFGSGSALKIGSVSTRLPNRISDRHFLMNGELKHTLHTDAGDILVIETETVSGSLAIEITDKSGTVLLDLPDAGANSLTLEVPGPVHVHITASRHRGSFLIKTEF